MYVKNNNIHYIITSQKTKFELKHIYCKMTNLYSKIIKISPVVFALVKWHSPKHL